MARKGGRDYVPPADRVATFDNDGTLWCEYPMQAQVFFLIDRVKDLARKDLSLKERQPYKALLEKDLKTLHGLGKAAIFELAFAAHAGMTDDAFDAMARKWLATAKHPQHKRPFPECAYQPQIELLRYLDQNEFRTFIVSGGGVGLIRAFSEETYGIPRERVVGSSVKTRFEVEDGRIQLMRAAELNSFDDREVKVQNIGLHIGRRPILVFGNSDGDLAMMRYAKTGATTSLALLLHHDDAGREAVYDREFHLSPLAEALDKAKDYGITVVSMQRDWKTVFTGSGASL